MTPLTVLAVAALVVTGTMVGVEFAVAVFVNPIFARLPLAASLAARTDGARVLGKVMPVWYAVSVILVGAWAALSWGTPAAAPALAAGILLAVAVVLSITLLVPINSRTASWAEGAAPADWRDQLQRWDRLHYVRLAIIVVAFVLAAVGLAIAA